MKNGLNCSLCDCVWPRLNCGPIIPPWAALPSSLPCPHSCPHWSLLTIVSLRLLGQLGLVDLVLSVGHLGVVLAVVLAEVAAHTSQLL